jgi:ferredoxin
MVCSIQHFGEFSSQKAAISIEERTKGFALQLAISNEECGRRPGCIGCLLCADACPVGQDLKRLIRLATMREKVNEINNRKGNETI